MKRELHYNGIRFVMETIQQSDQTWKCEARVFITAEGVDVPSLAFETEQEAEADTRNEVQWLIDCLHPEDFQIGARLKALPH